MRKCAARVAQLVERLTCNEDVAGSTPVSGSIYENIIQVGFPSGQREQTVNLSAPPSEVRILLSPPLIYIKYAGIAQLARASAFQAEGREFESRLPLQTQKRLLLAFAAVVLPSVHEFVAHVAQSVERFLGKEEVHRFDPGRGLHYFRQ